MVAKASNILTPVALLPAGLISWYDREGCAMALVTSWVALLGGQAPRIRTAWHGRHDPLSKLWRGGDFVLNIPRPESLVEICKAMSNDQFCLRAEADLNFTCTTGVAAVAPRLSECAVQIECIRGRLVDVGFDLELCGDVARVHRGAFAVDPSDIPDLCAIQPLSPVVGN